MSRLWCVTLALPEPLGARLHRARTLIDPGRAHMWPHVTLVPPTRIDGHEPVLARVREVARHAMPFELVLSGVDTFLPRTPAVFLRVNEGAEHAGALHAELVPPQSRPYRPHVTIANRCGEATLRAAIDAFAGFTASCRIDQITVFEHDGTHWAPIEVAELSAGRTGGSRPE